MFAVEMLNITKTFGEGFKANDSVSFKASKGEIHALVGENGAGKSTLMKILYGMYNPDEGDIRINGIEKSIASPSEAISLGIGMVHQHFMLVDTLTVLENIILGDETVKAGGIIDYHSSEKKINELTKSFNINIDLNAKTGMLPVGMQQKIEILKLLYRNAEILILDEPTAVLTPHETDELFKSLDDLRKTGKTVVLITHKLGEVLTVSNRVTVLRRGKSIAEVETSKTNKHDLAKLIIGEDVTPQGTMENIKIGEVILAVKDLNVKNHNHTTVVKNVSLEISGGEIFGVAGVEGNGQTELIETICGLANAESGTITVNGKLLTPKTQTAHIPADRLKHGIVKEYSLADNMILGRENEPRFSSKFTLKQNNIAEYITQMIAAYDIRPGDPYAIIGGLSGGNQQKLVAARELTKDTNLIIAEHPTRGLDIKASNFVHNALINESAKGKAVLVVSSDLSELLLLCSRIAVMYNGEIKVILKTKDTNEREIGTYMVGVQKKEI